MLWECAAAEAERDAIRRKQATMTTAMGVRDGAADEVGSEPLSAGDNGSMPDEGQPQVRYISAACYFAAGLG